MARDDRPASAMAMLWTLARNQIAGGIGLSLVGPSAILSISTANRRRQATSGLVWLAYVGASRCQRLAAACAAAVVVIRVHLSLPRCESIQTKGLGDRLPAGRRYQNQLGAAKRLQSRGGVGSGAVNVVVSAELLRQFGLVDTTGNRDDIEPHVPRILHAQMTQAANTQYSDKITGLCRCVSQRAERREPRAQQRRRIDRRQSSGIDTSPRAFAIITSA
jgi:hypothetical protein